MGTRGLTCVYMGGKFRVAQYGQWDHWPSGAGVHILVFLKELLEQGQLNAFAMKVDKIQPASEEDVKSTWKACGAGDCDAVTLDVARKHKFEHPCFSRDTGWQILKLINEGQVTFSLYENGAWTDKTVKEEVSKVLIEESFGADSLFCEWAYVIDLDAATFEIYEGFQEAHIECIGKFSHMQGSEQYGPVTLAKSYRLGQLPSKEQFLEDLEGQE